MSPISAKSESVPFSLHDVRIVLVETTHPGNIGSVARAMKNMGLSQLVLLNPKCRIDSEASALASGASDILFNARSVTSFQEAINDCGLIVGTSARNRTLSWPEMTPRSCAQQAVKEVVNYPVAIVFGREKNGLTNEELQLCHYHLMVPANPEYPSLNLAQAVQIITYELRQAALIQPASSSEQDIYPLAEALEQFYQHLESTFQTTGFIVKNHPGQVMQKLRLLFARARPTAHELNILRGMLASIEKTLSKNNPD